MAQWFLAPVLATSLAWSKEDDLGSSAWWSKKIDKFSCRFHYVHQIDLDFRGLALVFTMVTEYHGTADRWLAASENTQLQGPWVRQ